MKKKDFCIYKKIASLFLQEELLTQKGFPVLYVKRVKGSEKRDI